jgi:hypothetical protein
LLEANRFCLHFYDQSRTLTEQTHSHCGSLLTASLHASPVVQVQIQSLRWCLLSSFLQMRQVRSLRSLFSFSLFSFSLFSFSLFSLSSSAFTILCSLSLSLSHSLSILIFRQLIIYISGDLVKLRVDASDPESLLLHHLISTFICLQPNSPSSPTSTSLSSPPHHPHPSPSPKPPSPSPSPSTQTQTQSSKIKVKASLLSVLNGGLANGSSLLTGLVKLNWLIF